MLFRSGSPATEALNLQADYIFEIGLTPNRVDGASHIGTARDLKAALDRALCLPTVDSFTVDNTDHPVEVVVENQAACPRYAGVTISNIQVAESPKWLQARLKSIEIGRASCRERV